MELVEVVLRVLSGVWLLWFLGMSLGLNLVGLFNMMPPQKAPHKQWVLYIRDD
jgi:hypothetical protein